MMKVAVTGASGFVGRNFLSRLVKGDFEIKVFRGDLLTGKGVDKFLEGSKILIHLAGQVLPGKTSMEEGNVMTTENLVSRVKGTTVNKIIFSSSVAVYGDSNGKVFKETDKCTPNTEYGRSKLAAEKIISNWSKETGGKSVIFRFFSIYGQGNRKGVVFNLCNDFIKKGKITVFGDGRQRRDLVYVDDVANLLELSVIGDPDGIYNVGSGENYSILDLISILEEISGKKCKAYFEKAESEKVDEILYSIDKLKNDFGWTSKIDIKEGMKRVYENLLRNER